MNSIRKYLLTDSVERLVLATADDLRYGRTLSPKQLEFLDNKYFLNGSEAHNGSRDPRTDVCIDESQKIEDDLNNRSIYVKAILKNLYSGIIKVLNLRVTDGKPEINVKFEHTYRRRDLIEHLV